MTDNINDKVTPEDCDKVLFTGRRFTVGYDENEVDDFVEDCGATIERLMRENDALRATVAGQKDLAKEYDELHQRYMDLIGREAELRENARNLWREASHLARVLGQVRNVCTKTIVPGPRRSTAATQVLNIIEDKIDARARKVV